MMMGIKEIRSHFNMEVAINKFQQKVESNEKSTMRLKTSLAEIKEKRSELNQEINAFYKKGVCTEKHVAENSMGYSYEKLIGVHLDHQVEEMIIYETYIEQKYQYANLRYFIHMVKGKCKSLKFVGLITKPLAHEQSKKFQQIRDDLKKYNIDFEFTFDKSLHDRKILFSNGLLVKIDYGLDIFQKNQHKSGNYEHCPCRRFVMSIWKSPYNLTQLNLEHKYRYIMNIIQQTTAEDFQYGQNATLNYTLMFGTTAKALITGLWQCFYPLVGDFRFWGCIILLGFLISRVGFDPVPISIIMGTIVYLYPHFLKAIRFEIKNLKKMIRVKYNNFKNYARKYVSYIICFLVFYAFLTVFGNGSPTTINKEL